MVVAVGVSIAVRPIRFLDRSLNGPGYLAAFPPSSSGKYDGPSGNSDRSKVRSTAYLTSCEVTVVPSSNFTLGLMW